MNVGATRAARLVLLYRVDAGIVVYLFQKGGKLTEAGLVTCTPA
jgi:hypothetical protein